MTQKTPAQMRADAEAELTPLGRRRMKLVKQLAEVDAELRPKIEEAREVEVSLRRIVALTGLSATTIRKWTGAL